MEAERTRKRVLTRRKPLSDCTNISHSSSLSLNPTKPKPSSSSSKPHPNKPSRACSTSASSNLDNASSNPSSPPPSIVSVPSSPKTSSLPGTFVDLETSEPISVVYSRRSVPNKRKDKGKAVAFPVSSTPILKVSDTRQKIDGVESANLPKAKALTVPCRKKQRAVSSQKKFKDPQLQDYIEKQKAYFKMIDEFKLPEEEVETDELD